MKKVALFAIALMAMLMVVPSCKKSASDKNSAVNEDSIRLHDSLATVLAEKDTLVQLLTDVSDGMNQIIELQNIMAVEDLNSDSQDKKTQLRNQVIQIQQLIADRTKRVAELEEQLKSSSSYTDEMKRQIETLKRELENSKNMVNKLTAELQAAHVQIDQLNIRVDSLNTVNTRTNEALTNEKQKVQEEAQKNSELTSKVNDANAQIVNQANQMNTCYYVVGSKSELKSHKIIETGFLRKTKVLEGDYTLSYFTKADKRSLNTINLHSNKAELMTKHPAGSYVIEEVNGSKVLKITNASKFWELTNFLVIKIG